jgi:hypothetical protein
MGKVHRTANLLMGALIFSSHVENGILTMNNPARDTILFSGLFMPAGKHDV